MQRYNTTKLLNMVSVLAIFAVAHPITLPGPGADLLGVLALISYFLTLKAL